MKNVILFSVFLLFVSCEVVFLAVLNEKPTIEVRNDKVIVNGVLGKRFYKKFVRCLEENPNVNTIVLDQVPGSINDSWNMKSCLLLNEKGLNTELLSTSIIASGGVDLFISGVERKIANGAKIGVHSWRGLKKEALDYPRDDPEHDMFLSYFDKIEMDTSFYWFTLHAAPADSMHWMTKQEIKRYNLKK